VDWELLRRQAVDSSIVGYLPSISAGIEGNTEPSGRPSAWIVLDVALSGWPIGGLVVHRRGSPISLDRQTSGAERCGPSRFHVSAWPCVLREDGISATIRGSRIRVALMVRFLRSERVRGPALGE
jgi:hypothetical protein